VITTNNYALIKLIGPAEKTITGIVIAEQYRDKPRWGWVLDVGEGLADATGQVIPPVLVPGDLVYFMQHAPEKMDYSDLGLGVLHFISECDVTIKVKIAQDEYGALTAQVLPIGNYVSIEPMEDTVRKQTDGGIFLPDQVIERPSKARVLAVGPGQRTMSGFYPPRVRPGEVIRYRAFSVQTVHFDALGINQKPATIIPYGDVLAVEVEDFETILKNRLEECQRALKCQQPTE